MSFLDAILGGIKRVEDYLGNLTPPEPIIKFGTGFTVTDDPSNSRTNIEITAGLSFTAGGDLSGDNTSQTVVGLYNNPLDSSMAGASDGDVIRRTSGKWKNITMAALTANLVLTSFPVGTNGDVLTTSGGVATWAPPSGGTLVGDVNGAANANHVDTLTGTGGVVALVHATTIKQTQGGTLLSPSSEIALTLQPRDPSYGPFHIGALQAATFNSTVDVTMAVGYNTDLSSTDAAIYWRLEQDYEVTPGTHWFEYYIEYFGNSSHRSHVFRPFYVQVDKSTDIGSMIFELPGYTTQGSISITSGDATQTYWQFLNTGTYMRNNYQLFQFNNSVVPLNAFFTTTLNYQVVGDANSAGMVIRGGTDGVYLEYGAGASVGLHIDGATGQIQTPQLAGSGTGYISLDASGNQSRVSSIPTGGISPGTAGQIFVSNATPAAVWTSLISYETTHGRFTSGGGGSDFKAVIGALTSFETSYASIHLVAGGTTPAAANAALYGDGNTSLVVNVASASGTIFFSASNNPFAALDANAKRLYVGNVGASSPFLVDWATPGQTQFFSGTSATSLLIATTDQSATATIELRVVGLTSDHATGNVLVTPQAPYTSALTNLTAGDLVINVPSSVGAGAKKGGLVVEYNGDPCIRIGGFSNGTYGAMWCMDGGTPSTTNYTFLGRSNETYFGVPTNGTMYFGFANTTFPVILTYQTVSFGDFGTIAIGIDLSTLTTPTMLSGSGVTTFTIGTNKSGATLVLEAGVASSQVSISTTAIELTGAGLLRTATGVPDFVLDTVDSGGTVQARVAGHVCFSAENPSGSYVLCRDYGIVVGNQIVKGTNYTIDAAAPGDEEIWMTGACTITLPNPSAYAGRHIRIVVAYDPTASGGTIARSGAETINGAGSNITLGATDKWSVLMVATDGTNWVIGKAVVAP